MRGDLKAIIPGFDVPNKNKRKLRALARAAWHHHIGNEVRWERIITRQMFFLLDRLYEICGDEYDVSLIVEGTLVRAKIEDLEFISTYYEKVEDLPPESTERFFGLRLWWECKKCDEVEISEIIFTLFDLGQKIDSFNPKLTHKCRKKIMNKHKLKLSSSS